MTKPFRFLLLGILILPLPALSDRPAELEKTVIPPPPIEQPKMDKPPASREQVGDILQIPDPSTEIKRPGIVYLDFPQRGTSMQRVRAQLGEPARVIPAVGNPPITRWEYNDRVVFFEYQHVIHTVAKSSR